MSTTPARMRRTTTARQLRIATTHAVATENTDVVEVKPPEPVRAIQKDIEN